jgi:hypothetical protein
MDIDGDTTIVNSKLPVAQSLKVTAKAISDYYTKAEYTSFMKPKGGKEKKLRKVRKKDEEVDLLEGIEDVPSGDGKGTGTQGTRVQCGIFLRCSVYSIIARHLTCEIVMRLMMYICS